MPKKKIEQLAKKIKPCISKLKPFAGKITPYTKKVVEIVHGIENGLYELDYENVKFFN